MKISSFDRQNIDVVRDSIEAALTAVAERHGVSFSLGSIRFSRSAFKVTLEGNVSGGSESFGARDAAAYRDFAASYGLKPEFLNQTFECRGRSFRLVGLRYGRAPKNIFVVADVQTGKEFVTSLKVVRAGFASRIGSPSTDSAPTDTKSIAA